MTITAEGRNRQGNEVPKRRNKAIIKRIGSDGDNDSERTQEKTKAAL
jgi:hypothetical protein